MTATLDDLRDLRLVIGDAYDTGDEAIGHRLSGWIDTAIRVREAQKTKNRTAWHDERLAAFEAALGRWRDECEAYAIGYGTETADFKAVHPMPQFRDFMASDRPGNICPTCGSRLDVPDIRSTIVPMKISKLLTVKLSDDEGFPITGTSSFSGVQATVQADEIRVEVRADGSKHFTVEGHKIRKDGVIGNVHTAILVKEEDVPTTILDSILA